MSSVESSLKMDILRDTYKMPADNFSSLDDYNNYGKALVSAIATDDDIDRNIFFGPYATLPVDCDTFTSYSLGNLDMDYMSVESSTNNFMNFSWADDIRDDTLDTRPADSVFSDFDQRDEYQLVSPNTILPMNISSVPSNGLIDTPLPEPVYNLGIPEVLREMTNDYLPGQIVREDKWLESRERPVYHMDNDHCYSARPPNESDEDEDDDDDDFFNSPPGSPNSVCSEPQVANRCVKRSQPITQNKNDTKRAKKQYEIREVDVETIPQPPVPKLKITATPVAPVTRRKRGRKPQSQKTEEHVKKPRIQNCEGGVNPKYLRRALHRNKKNYVTKSGRVTKINSVETSPSSSTSSSQHSSRCNSDSEETVDKRTSHNLAERHRRQELTNLFQQLRRQVPETKSNLKASKVSILQSSTNYIRELEACERQQILVKQKLEAELESRMALLKSLNLKSTIKVEPYSS